MLHVLENVRTTHERHVLADEVERRPVGELGVRLVDDDEAGRDVEQRRRTIDGSSTSPVGLFGEHRNVTAGRAASTTRRASAGSSVKSARPLALDDGGAGDAGDVGVQLVRRLERDDGCGRARRRSAAASAAPRSSRWRRTPARARTPCQSAIAARSAVAVAVGVAPPVDRRQLGRQLGPPVRRRRVRRLVGVQPHRRRRPGPSGTPRAPAGRRGPARDRRPPRLATLLVGRDRWLMSSRRRRLDRRRAERRRRGHRLVPAPGQRSRPAAPRHRT